MHNGEAKLARGCAFCDNYICASDKNILILEMPHSHWSTIL